MLTTLPSYLDNQFKSCVLTAASVTTSVTASAITAGTIKAGTVFSNWNAMESQFDGFKFLLENLKTRANRRKQFWKPFLKGEFQTILTELEVLFKDCQEKNFEGREILLLEMSVFKTKLKKRI